MFAGCLQRRLKEGTLLIMNRAARFRWEMTTGLAGIGAAVPHARSVLLRTFYHVRRQQERDPKANRWKIITHRTTKRSGRVFPLGRFLCPAAELRKNLAADMSALNGEFSGTPNFPKARSCILWRTRSLPDYGTITARSCSVT